MSDCIRPGCREKDLHPVTVRDYDGCCSSLCAEIMDGERKDDLIEELQAKLAESQKKEGELDRECDGLANRTANLHRQVDDLKAKLAEAEAQRKDSDDRLNQIADRYDDLNKRWFLAESKLAEAEAKLEKAEAELVRKTDKFNNTLQEIMLDIKCDPEMGGNHRYWATREGLQRVVEVIRKYQQQGGEG